MTIPSRVLGAGASQLSTVAICGDGKDGIVAAGTTRADATQLVTVMNYVETTPAGAGVMLPPTEMGEVIWITNTGANTLTVYPYEATTTINRVATGSVKKDHTGIFNAVTNTVWCSNVSALT